MSIVPPSNESLHFPTETLTALGPTALGRRIHTSRTRRCTSFLHRYLRDPILHSRDSPQPLPPIRLRNKHPAR